MATFRDSLVKVRERLTDAICYQENVIELINDFLENHIREDGSLDVDNFQEGVGVVNTFYNALKETVAECLNKEISLFELLGDSNLSELIKVILGVIGIRD